MNNCLIGIDIGTQSLKAVVTDTDLQVFGSHAVPYQPTFPQALWAEQDAGLWLAALRPAIAGALAAAAARPERVAALGIAGQLDGCLAVDARGEPLAPCIIWMDRRASGDLPQADNEWLMARTGVVLDSTHMAAKIRWFKHHHPAAREAARFHQPVSFLVERLTGRAVFDHALASTTMLYDLHRRAFDTELLELFGIVARELPAIGESDAVAGPLHRAGAALTGLPECTPVAVGTGDDFANALGAGVVEPGTVVVALGTAEVVGAVHDGAVIDPAALVETHGYAEGRYFVENPGWLSGGALAWLRRILRLADDAELNRLAADAPAGSDGLLFPPTLAGAMSPEWIGGARGVCYGLTPAHGPGHIARAMLEGCAFAMRDVIDRLEALGVATGQVLLLGGGARSRLWAQIRADVCGRPVALSAVEDSSPLGAALLAAVACGAQPSLSAAAGRVGAVRDMLQPQAEQQAVYERSYSRYRELFATLRPLFHAGNDS